MRLGIECEGLRRVYGSRGSLRQHRETVALERLDLAITAGQIYGLLGPNGAGKTTTTKILTTLLTRSDGVARVAGFDVVRQADDVRRRVGFVFGGERGLSWRLLGRDNILYFGALYGMPPSVAARRAQVLLQLVGLANDADRRVE